MIELLFTQKEMDTTKERKIKMVALKHCGTQVIETDRLVLRPYTTGDAEEMYQNWANSEEVTRYLTWPPHSSVEATRSLLEMWVKDYRNPAVYHWGITLKGRDQVIGDISVVQINEKTAAAELGWCMGQAWWGQGIMPEAALAVRDFLFDRAGFHRVEARHDKNNPKSGRVMQKIGMQYEGTKRAADVNNQGICDTVMYAILRDDRK